MEIYSDTFVHYIKTNTGFGKRGVTKRDVELINRHKNSLLEIKAAGGIDSFDKMNELINAGASRIGTSYSVKILKQMKEEK